MNRISTWTMALLLVSSVSAPLAGAEPTRSAGVREISITPYEHAFGGDGFARAKYKIFQRGYKSITAYLRMTMASPTDSYVYLPPMRSKQYDLDLLIARVNHAEGHTILKPMIS